MKKSKAQSFDNCKIRKHLMHPYFRKVNPDCTCFRVLFIYLDNENVFDAIFGIFLKSANKERTPIYCNTHKKLCTIDDRSL